MAVCIWHKGPLCNAYHDIWSSKLSKGKLTLAMLNKLRCQAHFQFWANQIAWFRLLIQVQKLYGKECRSKSVGFFRSRLIWTYTVCKCRAYLGSAGQGLNKWIYQPIDINCSHKHLLGKSAGSLNSTFITEAENSSHMTDFQYNFHINNNHYGRRLEYNEGKITEQLNMTN